MSDYDKWLQSESDYEEYLGLNDSRDKELEAHYEEVERRIDEMREDEAAQRLGLLDEE